MRPTARLIAIITKSGRPQDWSTFAANPAGRRLDSQK